MQLVFSIFVFAGGLAVGSFINCLVYRLHLRDTLIFPSTSKECIRTPSEVSSWQRFLFGRSFCPHCQHQLAWQDNIPLLSFVLLRGRCRYCHSPISWHYPLVELGAGVLTVFSIQYSVFRGIALPYTIYYILLIYCLIAIFLSDLLYFTIPDEIVYPAIGLTILFQLCRSTIRGVPPEADHLGGGTIWVTPGVSPWLAALGAAGFFLFLVLITKGKGMGLGDVKLAGLMGLVLGFSKIIVALYLAFLTGAVVGVILILLGKKRFGEQIPFGPFLSTATIVSLFWGEIIWEKARALLSLSF